MDYTALERKLAFYREHSILIPEMVTRNYEAAFRVEYLPISIPVGRRHEYFATLEAYACEDDLLPFAALIGELEEARLDQYITAIEQVRGCAGPI